MISEEMYVVYCLPPISTPVPQAILGPGPCASKEANPELALSLISAL